MWDVKSVVLHKNFLMSAFYLNYVGCKGKAEERRDKTASVISFYLNYVGCKALMIISIA